MMCLDNDSLIIPPEVNKNLQQQMKFKEELRTSINSLLTQKAVSTSGIKLSCFIAMYYQSCREDNCRQSCIIS